MVRTLLNGGGNPIARNGDGLTVLQLFVRVAPDQGDTAALLIDAGADPDRKYPNGDAPLHAAIRSGGNRGKVDVAEALLSGGADPCVRDAKRYTPMRSHGKAVPSTGCWRRRRGRVRRPEVPMTRLSTVPYLTIAVRYRHARFRCLSH